MASIFSRPVDPRPRRGGRQPVVLRCGGASPASSPRRRRRHDDGRPAPARRTRRSWRSTGPAQGAPRRPWDGPTPPLSTLVPPPAGPRHLAELQAVGLRDAAKQLVTSWGRRTSTRREAPAALQAQPDRLPPLRGQPEDQEGPAAQGLPRGGGALVPGAAAGHAADPEACPLRRHRDERPRAGLRDARRRLRGLRPLPGGRRRHAAPEVRHPGLHCARTRINGATTSSSTTAWSRSC